MLLTSCLIGETETEPMPQTEVEDKPSDNPGTTINSSTENVSSENSFSNASSTSSSTVDPTSDNSTSTHFISGKWSKVTDAIDGTFNSLGGIFRPLQRTIILPLSERKVPGILEFSRAQMGNHGNIFNLRGGNFV